MLGFIITSLIIGLILFCISIYTTVVYDKPDYIPIVVIAGLYLLCSILYIAFSPTNSDVRNRTAEYVKEHHIEISSNDTIEYDIYRLEWINKQ